MHGYQLMQAIAERSGGRWRPSPGVVYPTLSQLEDEGAITLTTAEGGRRMAVLTEEGRALAERVGGSWADVFEADDDGDGVDLRLEMMQLHEAVRVVGRTGTSAQRHEVARLVADARRRVYLVLAGDPPAPEPEAGTGDGPGGQPAAPDAS
ncbi:PadR family transcriptional regulator [Georgenia sp. TF02-10]|nr:PadR family transcriptional regulator [Georgenia sp. TF02-10]